jgi:4-amino-4-deoxy-L-arabinose transferase-like glycosyltransferase
MKIIMEWIKKNRTEFIIFILVILITLGLRLYRIDAYMTFLGDEGRDALMIKRILTTGDIPLLGPPTSVGNMYLGPLYYYMMAISMAVFWLNPLAAAVMVAFIGTATVGLIYYLARNWFGKTSALIAAFLYAISPVNIIYSRSSWNPNPAPFFALLSIAGLYWARKKNNFLYFIITGAALAFAVQMHYLALILLPVAGILWLYELFLRIKKQINYRYFWTGTVGAITAFGVLMSPLIIFDLNPNHPWMNTRAILTFFSDRQTTVNLNFLNTLGRIPTLYFDTLVGRYIGGHIEILSWVVGVLILFPVGFFGYRLLKKQFDWPLFVLSVWILVGVAGLSLYKQNIYDHYLGFINPVVYLLLGACWYLASKLPKKFMAVIGGLWILTFGLVIANFSISPLRMPPNNQFTRTEKIADFIIQEAEGKPFNFALIAEHNYDAAYQFILDAKGHKPLQVPFDITDQLFVVCEDTVCQPVGNPKYEIAAFGWTKVESEQNFEGVKVFKLVHNQPADQSQ